MSEFNEGEQVYIVSFDIDKKLISGIDVIDGVNKYWLYGMFGYYTKHDLFKSKNEAIDYLIKALEARKDA
jgi:hypothetical protein